MYIIKTITYTLALLLCLAACKTKQKEPPLILPDDSVLAKIEHRGTLNVCTYYNTTDYYVYKGVPKGFHHDLVKDLAQHLGVKLHVEVSTNMEQCIRELNEGKHDLIAMSLTVTPDRRQQARFTLPLFNTSTVLVQNNRADTLARDIRDLQGKQIYIQPGTSGKTLLRHLDDSLQLNLTITELEDHTYEDILLKVENGQLPYTVIDKNIALMAARYMTHLDLTLELFPVAPVAWAVAKNAEFLQQEINQWLATYKKKEKFHVLYNRYYKSTYVTTLHNSKYYKLKNGVISGFDPIIKQEAAAIGWDWRLLAAVIYQESGFDPEATSPSGAIGLMQVMPETALQLGFEEYTDPRQNIRAGARYLKHLQDMFVKHDLDTLDHLKFTLAAYNAGPGHVFDAMRLAEYYGKKPRVWNNNVDFFILHKNRPELYRDTLSRNGYCDGKQTFNFVNNIMENYTHYKNTVKK